MIPYFRSGKRGWRDPIRAPRSRGVPENLLNAHNRGATTTFGEIATVNARGTVCPDRNVSYRLFRFPRQLFW
jgi:hypothetical protein